MSGRSQKQAMRDALQTMERGLGSLIAAQFEGTQSRNFVEIAAAWRSMARRVLGHVVEDRECICPKCGIRHGVAHRYADF